MTKISSDNLRELKSLEKAKNPPEKWQEENRKLLKQDED